MILCNSSDRIKARQRAEKVKAWARLLAFRLIYAAAALILMIPLEVW